MRKSKRPKRSRAHRRNPIAKAVRRIAPKVKPARRRPPPQAREWDEGR